MKFQPFSRPITRLFETIPANHHNFLLKFDVVADEARGKYRALVEFLMSKYKEERGVRIARRQAKQKNNNKSSVDGANIRRNAEPKSEKIVQPYIETKPAGYDQNIFSQDSDDSDNNNHNNDATSNYENPMTPLSPIRGGQQLPPLSPKLNLGSCDENVRKERKKEKKDKKRDKDKLDTFMAKKKRKKLENKDKNGVDKNVVDKTENSFKIEIPVNSSPIKSNSLKGSPEKTKISGNADKPMFSDISEQEFSDISDVSEEDSHEAPKLHIPEKASDSSDEEEDSDIPLKNFKKEADASVPEKNAEFLSQNEPILSPEEQIQYSNIFDGSYSEISDDEEPSKEEKPEKSEKLMKEEVDEDIKDAEHKVTNIQDSKNSDKKPDSDKSDKAVDKDGKKPKKKKKKKDKNRDKEKDREKMEKTEKDTKERELHLREVEKERIQAEKLENERIQTEKLEIK